MPVYDLERVAMMYRSDVNIWEIQRSADQLYKAVKIVGIDNVTTKSYDSNLNAVEKSGAEISKRVRAMSGYITLNMYHMSDTATSINRLESHLGGISFETALGYRIGEIGLTSEPIYDVLRRYLNNTKLDKHEEPVPVQQLYKLIELRKTDIELWPLWVEIEQLFKSIVTVGVESTVIWYYDHNLKKVVKKGYEISERMRAFCGQAVIHMYRLKTNDTHKNFMQKRLGLSQSIEMILSDTNVFMDKADDLKCISLKDMVARYLLQDDIEISLNSPVCIQELYEVIILRRFKPQVESLKNLWMAIDTLYKTVKIMGIKNTRAWYWDEKQNRVLLKGNEISERIRAFGEEVVIYMYRMDDETVSRSRLEKHLGLDHPSKYILGDTKLFKDANASMPCICLLEMEKRYFSME